ncbi:MAG: hypothetical protein H6907_21870 [Hyphomicrobiales bacterium]|nr:hypothetical protein [Hyphomicrobiales bacterium]MCP5374393.1 hypothetical protein [Hyphomicrobiales bacterium]
MVRIVAAVLAALVLWGAGARAQEANVLTRLMDEPLTLFDWGLAQLDRDIARAARDTLPRRVGLGAVRPQTGSIYDWRSKRVTLFVSAALPPAQRTRQACAAVFRDIVRTLTDGAPQGASAAGWYLLNAFKPKGHYWGDRFEDVGTKLLDVVRLEVSFIPATFESLRGDRRRVSCAGRLDADPEELAVEETS